MTSQKIHTKQDDRPVFGYIRVSTDRQEVQRQQGTLPERHNSLPDGLHARKLELFYDNGISAWSGATRPGFEEMFARITRGEAAALIIDTSSRLTRQGIGEAVTIFATLKSAGTRLFATSGGEYEFNLAGWIRLIVDAEGDERYSANISHNTSTGKDALAAAGYWPHGKVPLGYEAVEAPDNPKRKVLTLSAAADAYVEATRMFDEDHANQRDIHRYLTTTLGIKLDRTAIRLILMNPTYLGRVKGANGALYPGRHPALVTEDRFERIQQRLARAATENRRAARKWPFAGVARCAECGHTLRHRSKKNNRYHYVECTNPNFPQKTCGTLAMPAGVFEANVLFYVGAVAHAVKLRLAHDPSFGVVESQGDDLSAARARLAEATERLETITDLIIDGSLRRSDPRYEQAKEQKDTAAEDVRRLSLHASSHRDELEAFVARVESVSAVHPSVARWLDREHPSVRVEGSDPELYGDRFAEQAVVGWQYAAFEKQRELIERTFSRIELDASGVSLDFHTALPHTLTLPLVFDLGDREARAIVEEDGFGKIETGVPLYESARS